MKKIGCYFNRHTYVLVAINNEYHTTYVGSEHKRYYNMRFYECEHCGHRSFQTNYDNKYNRHSGIDNAKLNWIEVRTVPKDSYDPRIHGHKPAPVISKPPKVVQFDVIKGGKNE